MTYMGASKNSGTPKSSILIGCSIINHSFGISLFLETPIYSQCEPCPSHSLPDWATPTPLAEACDFPRRHEQGVRSPDAGRYEPKIEVYTPEV